jgi:glucose/arabinose dehydrogenase
VSTTGAPLPTTSPPTTDPPPTTVPLDDLNLVLEAVADGFDQPVLAVSPPGDPRLFVVDQPGRIWVVENDEVHEFLDIRDAVRFRGEQGLLGLAFHPGYSDNGLFYVDFTNSRGGTVLSEFQVDPSNPNEARPGTRRDVLLVSQPATNHNGGMIAFGPDGLLWLGLGDGGGANDRYRNGQRSDRRLASMLRIEVGPDAPEPFGDPVDAPFLDDGGLPEVWSVGLRNPWRFSFDRDRLYIGDVGQNNIEEINVVPAAEGGINFGWPILEGSDCFRATSCNTDGRRAPVLEYTHRRGCSVTGGFVYRGSAIPELTGHYFFGDYCSGWVESIVVGDDFSVTDRREWFDAGTIPGLTSFGLDASGEIYVMGVGGVVYRIVRG